MEYGRLRCASGVLERGVDGFESGYLVGCYRREEGEVGYSHAAHGLGGQYTDLEILWEYFVSYLAVMVGMGVGLVISSCGLISLLGEVVTSGLGSWVSYWSRCAVG